MVLRLWPIKFDVYYLQFYVDVRGKCDVELSSAGARCRPVHLMMLDTIGKHR